MSEILFNKTKIVATVGPATNSKSKLTELIKEGVDVIRLNFSHGSHEDHFKVIQFVKEINEELKTNICLLQDLQGPKIRVGEMEPGVILEEGSEIKIRSGDGIGNSEVIYTQFSELIDKAQPGHKLLLNDGQIELKVTEAGGKSLTALVLNGGELKSKKGINLPDTRVLVPSLTPKDLKDLQFGIEHDVDWVALSFVRSPKDIHDLREILNKSGKWIKIIAKIEKPEALEFIDEIINTADAIMVARGDLGVETPMEEVPLIQKMIVEKCNIASKPVIIATQMMESMIENPKPTRAETNDIANAVMDGADALMLSAETATGKYPLKVIQSMVKTIISVESHDRLYFRFYPTDKNSPIFLNDSVVASSVVLAKETNAKAMVGMTQSGYTVYKVASYRPKTSIFAFTANKPLLRTLSLVWGVRGYYYDKSESTDSTISDIEEILIREGHLSKGDVFINMASMPIHARERTNMLKINIVK